MLRSPVHSGEQRCGSAWSSANRSYAIGGDRTDAEREAAADACERAGETALRRVAAIAGLAVVAGATGYAVRRSHSE